MSAKPTNRPLLPRILLFVLILVVFSILSPSYRNLGNVYSIFEAFAFTGLIALGLGVVMVAGELDLSVGSVAAIAGILAIQWIEWGVITSVIITTFLALVFGLLQGYLIGRLRINSVVFTIGISMALRGLAFVISKETSAVIPIQYINVVDLITYRIGVFSPFSLTTIAVAVALGLLLRLSRRGREIYAIGGGRSEAISAGISLPKTFSLAFMICAGCAGLAGALVSIKSGSANPAAHNDIMFIAITGVLIADFGISGGTGTIPGLFLGVITLTMLTTGLSSLQVPKDIQNFAIGTLLVLVIIIDFSIRSAWFNALQERLRPPISLKQSARS